MRSNDSKYITIIALVLAVVGISIGFAAYSNTVQIKAQADVRPSGSNFEGGILSTDPDDPEE